MKSVSNGQTRPSKSPRKFRKNKVELVAELKTLKKSHRELLDDFITLEIESEKISARFRNAEKQHRKQGIELLREIVALQDALFRMNSLNKNLSDRLGISAIMYVPQELPKLPKPISELGFFYHEIQKN